MTTTSHTETQAPKPPKPDTTPKRASEMTPEEYKKARADVARGVLPPYVPGR